VAWLRGIEHARLAKLERIEHELQTYVLSASFIGPAPASEVLPLVQEVVASSPQGTLRHAGALRMLGGLLAFEGRTDEARELHGRGADTYKDAGLLVTAAGWAMSLSFIERRAGDQEAEVRVLREGYEQLRALDDRYFLPTVAVYLADALANREDDHEAEIEELCAVVRERSISGDLVNFVGLDVVEARMLARGGKIGDALRLAVRGLDSADTTDMYDLRAKARLGLAEVCARAEDQMEVERVAAEVVSIYEQKGDVTGAAWAREHLRGFGVQTS
jgi:hypothetical protein